MIAAIITIQASVKEYFDRRRDQRAKEFAATIEVIARDQAIKVEEVRVAALEAAKKVAAQVDEVKQSAAKVATDIQETKIAVDGNMRVQLDLNRVMAKRIAQSGNPLDIRAAELAEHAYQEHMKTQTQIESSK